VLRNYIHVKAFSNVYDHFGVFGLHGHRLRVGKMATLENAVSLVVVRLVHRNDEKTSGNWAHDVIPSIILYYIDTCSLAYSIVK